MTVKFIVQVLSELAAKNLQTFGTTEASETAKCCQLLDHFFNCLNVRTLVEHQKKTKPLLKAYTDENDGSFSWMTDQFLPYLNAWKENTENKSIDFH